MQSLAWIIGVVALLTAGILVAGCSSIPYAGPAVYHPDLPDNTTNSSLGKENKVCPDGHVLCPDGFCAEKSRSYCPTGPV